MKTIEILLPELVGIAATRGMLGAGLALLLGKCLDYRQRHRLGVILTTIGIVSTAPFAYDVLHRRAK